VYNGFGCKRIGAWLDILGTSISIKSGGIDGRTKSIILSMNRTHRLTAILFTYFPLSCLSTILLLFKAQNHYTLSQQK
jgi:hypothetical protein